MLTQNDIAQQVGLSRMTVHRYLSGEKVSPKTKEKLDAFLAKDGYRPNLTARSLVSKKTNLIGLIVPSVSYSFYPDLIQYIQGEIKNRGYNLILCVSTESPEQEMEEIDLLLSIPVDGIILIPTSYSKSEENCNCLSREKIPFVLVDRNIPCLNASSVCTDGYNGSRNLVEHLITLGHRRIAHFGGPHSNSFAEDVFKGYQDTLSVHDIDVEDDLVFSGSMEEENGYTNFSKMLRLKQSLRPTAIQAVNDIVALGVVKAALEHNIDIPGEIALVGFSDLRLSSLIPVPLTTVRENTSAMAETAVSLLMNQFGKKRKRKVVKRIDGEIIIRKSSGTGLK